MKTFALSVAILVALVLPLEVARAQSGDVGDVTEEYDQFAMPKTHKECRLYTNAECKYKGKKYRFFQTWLTDECHNCTCYDDAVICCDVLQLPIEWHYKCMPKINKEHCRVDIVRIDKPSLPCATRRPRKDRKNSRRKALMFYRHKPMVISV